MVEIAFLEEFQRKVPKQLAEIRTQLKEPQLQRLLPLQENDGVQQFTDIRGYISRIRSLPRKNAKVSVCWQSKQQSGRLQSDSECQQKTTDSSKNERFVRQ